MILKKEVLRSNTTCTLIDQMLQRCLREQVRGLVAQLPVSAATERSVLPPAPFTPVASLLSARGVRALGWAGCWPEVWLAMPLGECWCWQRGSGGVWGGSARAAPALGLLRPLWARARTTRLWLSSRAGDGMWSLLLCWWCTRAGLRSHVSTFLWRAGKILRR